MGVNIRDPGLHPAGRISSHTSPAGTGRSYVSKTVARASAVAGTIRADGATVAAKMLLDAVAG